MAAARPTLIYDGECRFCLLWIERWREITGDAVDYRSSQASAADFPEIAPARFETAVQLVECGDGRSPARVSEGAGAVFGALEHGGLLWPMRLYRRLPMFARLTELAYRLVAGNRGAASLATSLLWGKDTGRLRQARVRPVILSGIGLVYAIAFVSLWVQVEGLIGSEGILPATSWLEAVYGKLGPRAYRLVPTLAWLGSSDVALNLLCAGGLLASLTMTVGLLPRPAAMLCWAFYLSLYSVGRVFLSFQWDILLLESGFLAILLSPKGWGRGRARELEPPRAVMWLFRWLLFRLMLLSGLAKLLSGDQTWRDLSALGFHYYTQPLPVWISWYVHHLPAALHRFSTFMMFVIELGLPFLVFMPRRPRMLAFTGFVLLQLLIMATGNYTFFNILTLVLVLSLLDDRALARLPGLQAPAAGLRGPRPGGMLPAGLGRGVLLGLVTTALLLTSSAQMLGRIGVWDSVPGPVKRMVAASAPYHLTSSYGLFSVMTKRRPEIIIEGSHDGKTWSPYEFRYKPGDPSRRPRFVQPHQPRLDWQMWFAALSNYHRESWFRAFLDRLGQGSPAVISLLAADPFEGNPPARIRARLYRYEFSSPEERRDTGRWWRREPRGLYMPERGLAR